MQNKTVLVTGSTDGIGKQTALELAQQGAQVIVHGRSREKAQTARDDIRRATGNNRVGYVAADLASLAEVRTLAQHVLSEYDRLEVLINNAGVFAQTRLVSVDGYELSLAVNHLAPFLLTNLLLEQLQASAPARVITVSSVAHNRGRMDFENLNSEKSFGGYAAYAMSKLANVLFAYELAERVKAAGVTSNALHPGVITTKLLAQGFNTTGESLAQGAATSVYLATSPEVEGVTGQYFDKCRAVASSPLSHDRALQQRLWRESERLTGLVK